MLAPLVAGRPSKDLAIYVHAPAGSDGHLRRFEVLRPLLDAEGVRYDVFTHFDDARVKDAFAAGRPAQYRLYSRIFWKRLFQVWEARRYHALFIQRGLFPLYPDVRVPHLERLARRLCPNITLDFWDPVHLWQPELTFSSFRYADKVAVVNQALFDAYAAHHPRLRLLPIAVDVEAFEPKREYALGHPARLLYTGSAGNVKANLEPLVPALVQAARDHDFELIVVGDHAPEDSRLRVRRVPWERNSYAQLLAQADLALFPYFDSPAKNRLRVASKTLDYMAAGLPFVGVPEGLAVGVEAGRHFFPVEDPAQWPARIHEALSDHARRESVGRAARQLVETSFSLEKSYEDFKRIAFEEVGRR